MVCRFVKVVVATDIYGCFCSFNCNHLRSRISDKGDPYITCSLFQAVLERIDCGTPQKRIKRCEACKNAEQYEYPVREDSVVLNDRVLMDEKEVVQFKRTRKNKDKEENILCPARKKILKCRPYRSLL